MSLFKKFTKALGIKPITFGYQTKDDLDTSNPPGKKFKHANTIPVCEYLFDERDYITKDKVDPFGGWGDVDMIYLKDIWENKIARDYVHHYYHYRNDDNTLKHNVSNEVIDYIERHLKVCWIEAEERGSVHKYRCAVSNNFELMMHKRYDFPIYYNEYMEFLRILELFKKDKANSNGEPVDIRKYETFLKLN